MSTKRIIDVLVPDGYKPQRQEVQAAWILAEHYQSVVEVLRPTMGYKEKTPDFKINDEYYELKTPVSRKTEHILFLFRAASQQATIVVIDARKTKIHETRMIELCGEAIQFYRKIQKVVLILGRHRVLDFMK